MSFSHGYIYGKIAQVNGLSDELEWYFVNALAGQIHEVTGREAEIEFGSQHTPVNVGLTEGYSVQDVAYFYEAPELGNRWVEEILVNLNEKLQIRLENALSKFCTDVRFEKQYVVQMMRDEIGFRNEAIGC